MKDIIDLFYEQSCRLNGHEIAEREQWNTFATAQEIKKFSYSISDDNPLWLDAEYARSGPYGRQVAPPSFFLSVLYPMLHGALMDLPISNMASQLQFDWHLPVYLGDELQASARQTSVRQGSDRQGRRVIYIDSETQYRNQDAQTIGTANATVAWIDIQNRSRLLERQIHVYSEAEINKIKTAINNYKRRGKSPIDPLTLNVGDTLPKFVLAPLTLGDISYWEAVTGPNYRPGSFAVKHSGNGKIATFKNPLTGWEIQKGQSHLDSYLAMHRGVPASFDYGVMRFAFLSVWLTDWIGDFGKLQSLKVNFLGIVIYGDATFYTGRIVNKKILKNDVELTIKISGRNQLNSQIASAESVVRIPLLASSKKSSIQLPTKSQYENKPLTNSFIHLFKQNVIRRPNAVAVRDWQSEITYAELDKRSGRLAAGLADLGAKANTIIGILLNRNIDWIVALISIWKCGATYLPIDTDSPRKRIQFIFDEAAASILISKSSLTDSQLYNNLKIYLLDRERSEIKQHDRIYKKQSIQSEDLAYLMYTSGSSGNSKAVYISNRALSEYLKILPSCLPLVAGDRYLSTASFMFSASIRQICYPLAYGARLIIADENERKDPLSLTALIDKEKITIWDTVPSVWFRSCERILSLKADTSDHSLYSLNKIVLTGEPLRWEQLNQWYRNFKQDIRIINLYSQTESTGTVSSFNIHPGQIPEYGIVPIGKSLPDTHFFLLDENLNPVQKGSSGEICLNNNRLASGCAGEDGLMSKYVVDFQGMPVYRTGDLARLNSNGYYEFVGRKDRRIKMRGFRIDLDAIESVLNQHPQINESAVIVLEKASSEQLIAFISPGNNDNFSLDQLRMNLKQQLPDFMIPHIMTTLDELPRTQSGKIDRNGLLVTGFSKMTNHGSKIVSPRTAIEKSLTEIWQDVIGVHPVGIRDDFFDLGGDSLIAIELFNEIEKKTKRKLSVGTLTNLSTIENMASFIDNDQESLLPLNKINETKEYPAQKESFVQTYPDHYKRMLSAVAGRNWQSLRPGSLIVNIVPDNGNKPIFYCANALREAEPLARRLGPDYPFYYLESGRVTKNREQDYIKSLAQFHVKDILTIQENGPFFIMGYSYGCSVAFEMARQLSLQGKEIAFLGLLDAQIGPDKQYIRLKKVIEKLDFARIIFNYPDKIRQKFQTLFFSPAVMIFLKNFLINHKNNNNITKKSYVPLAYKNEFYIFQASEAILRNMLFPLSGWPQKDFPQVRIISIPGDHLSILEGENLKVLSDTLKKVLVSKGVFQ